MVHLAAHGVLAFSRMLALELIKGPTFYKSDSVLGRGAVSQ